MSAEGMVKRLAEKAYEDLYSVAPKYRTGQYMQVEPPKSK